MANDGEKQPSRYFLAHASSDLAEASEVIIAGGGHLGHVMFHGQFAVEMEAKVADDSGRLDVGRADLD